MYVGRIFDSPARLFDYARQCGIVVHCKPQRNVSFAKLGEKGHLTTDRLKWIILSFHTGWKWYSKYNQLFYNTFTVKSAMPHNLPGGYYVHMWFYVVDAFSSARP